MKTKAVQKRGLLRVLYMGEERQSYSGNSKYYIPWEEPINQGKQEES